MFYIFELALSFCLYNRTIKTLKLVIGLYNIGTLYRLLTFIIAFLLIY